MRPPKNLLFLLLLSFFFSSPAWAQVSIESEDATVEIGGRVQAGYTTRFLEEGDDDYSDRRIFLKQARLQAKFEAFEFFSGEIGFDLVGNDGLPEAKDVYLRYSPTNWFSARLGQFKIPVSRQRLQSSSKTLFIGRLDPTKRFITGRDVGLELDFVTPNKLFRARLTANTGQGDNVDREDSQGLPTYTARLSSMVLGEVDKGEGDVNRTRVFSMELGAFGSYSRDAGPRMARDGKLNERVSIDGTRVLYGGDLTVKYKGFFFNGEFAGAQYTPDNGETYYAAGFLTQASYYVDLIRLEPAARFNFFNPSDLEDDVTEMSITAGLNYYPMRTHDVKAMLNYTHHLPYSDQDDHGWKNNELTLLLQLAIP